MPGAHDSMGRPTWSMQWQATGGRALLDGSSGWFEFFCVRGGQGELTMPSYSRCSSTSGAMYVGVPTCVFSGDGRGSGPSSTHRAARTLACTPAGVGGSWRAPAFPPFHNSCLNTAECGSWRMTCTRAHAHAHMNHTHMHPNTPTRTNTNVHVPWSWPRCGGWRL